MPEQTKKFDNPDLRTIAEPDKRKGKGILRPITRHEGPGGGGSRGIALHFL